MYFFLHLEVRRYLISCYQLPCSEIPGFQDVLPFSFFPYTARANPGWICPIQHYIIAHLCGFGKRWFWGYVSRTGTWISAPNSSKNFLPFLKNAELSANEARFWPISRKKACCGDVKQELARNYFDIDPRQVINPRDCGTAVLLLPL